MLKGTAREASAEILGTFVLVVFGVGACAQMLLSQQHNGTYLSINLGWGLAVTMGVYVAGGVSGAHLNPAITLAMAIFHRCPWKKVVPFIVAQTLGAFLASAAVYATYHEALNNFDQGFRRVTGPLATAGIWATYPQPFLSNFPGGLIDQTVGTALLVLIVFALSDQKNQSPDRKFSPIVIGAAVMLIGMTFGYNSGYAINPARDFGPRLFTAIAGWGTEVFRAGNHWWWVPIVGPSLGAVAGGFSYQALVEKHHPCVSECEP